MIVYLCGCIYARNVDFPSGVGEFFLVGSLLVDFASKMSPTVTIDERGTLLIFKHFSFILCVIFMS